ncbi:hypothetical protein FS749_003045 [Ceratobasidium sp. UAMH 11750]|nr:hypothetical protein FS749_003045 [Ceratobasidium sp. UAMH 11750]
MPDDIFWYQPYEARGVTIQIVAACLSFVSIISLFFLLAWISITGRGRMNKPFLRTRIGAYVVSLMVVDFAQAIGGITSIRWVADGHISAGRFCAAQGAIKLFSSLGIAVWSVVIAFHTFRMLFFNTQTSRFSCIATLTIVWSGIIVIVIVGPTIIESETKGDYYGIAGYWCWITSGYKTERFAFQYFFMFASASVSLVVYSLIFFRLRGNLVGEGYKIRILRVPESRAWNLETGCAVMESKIMNVAWRLMWYPLSYTMLILPLAATRWAEFSGTKVPFQATMFAYTIYMLSGFVNTVLFITTRRVLPPIKLRRGPVSPSAGRGISISISVHATSVQQASSAASEPPCVVSLPLSKHTEAQAYELGDRSHLEKNERRLSGESAEASYIGADKDEYDAEANVNRNPRVP